MGIVFRIQIDLVGKLGGREATDGKWSTDKRRGGWVFGMPGALWSGRLFVIYRLALALVDRLEERNVKQSNMTDLLNIVL